MDEDDTILAYVQGRLDASDAAAFETALADNADLRAEMATLQAVGTALAAQAPDRAVRDRGWAALSNAIDADRFGTPANTNQRPSVLQAAGIAVAAVMAWQFIAVPFLPTRQDAGLTPASENVPADGPVLRVAFVDDVPLADVVAVLTALGAEIIDGPSAVGLFTIEFSDEGTLNEAEALFAERSDLVTMVSRP
ncbi:MAG: hypothetical protein AAFY65_17805 [Pseudomonadota bacterium]